MKLRKKRILITAVMLVAILTALFSMQQFEPSYGGMKLTHWLLADYFALKNSSESEKAFNKMGESHFES